MYGPPLIRGNWKLLYDYARKFTQFVFVRALRNGAMQRASRWQSSEMDNRDCSSIILRSRTSYSLISEISSRFICTKQSVERGRIIIISTCFARFMIHSSSTITNANNLENVYIPRLNTIREDVSSVKETCNFAFIPQYGKIWKITSELLKKEKKKMSNENFIRSW